MTLEVLIDELSADQLFVLPGLCSWIQEKICSRITDPPTGGLMSRWILVGLIAMSGLAVAGGMPTTSSWDAAVQKKVPPNGTLFNTGKFKMLCQCHDGSSINNRTGAIETYIDPSTGIIDPSCDVPIFNPDGSLLTVEACNTFVPLSKP